MSIINEINFYIIYKRERQRPAACIAACGNVFWGPFWPTCVNRHALADRAGCALSTDAWQLTRVCQNAAKTDSSWWGCCAMVRAAAVCFVVVAWLSYDTHIVKYNAPTTPQPCETFPWFFAMIKWCPVLSEHSWIISSMRRLFCRGEQLVRDENRVSIFGGNIWGFGDTSAHYSAR